MFIPSAKTNSDDLVYTFNFVGQINRKIVYIFWMNEYFGMSDLKGRKDFVCLSADFKVLFQENEQEGKNPFLKNCF